MCRCGDSVFVQIAGWFQNMQRGWCTVMRIQNVANCNILCNVDCSMFTVLVWVVKLPWLLATICYRGVFVLLFVYPPVWNYGLCGHVINTLFLLLDESSSMTTTIEHTKTFSASTGKPMCPLQMTHLWFSTFVAFVLLLTSSCIVQGTNDERKDNSCNTIKHPYNRKRYSLNCVGP